MAALARVPVPEPLFGVRQRCICGANVAHQDGKPSRYHLETVRHQRVVLASGLCLAYEEARPGRARHRVGWEKLPDVERARWVAVAEVVVARGRAPADEPASARRLGIAQDRATCAICGADVARRNFTGHLGTRRHERAVFAAQLYTAFEEAGQTQGVPVIGAWETLADKRRAPWFAVVDVAEARAR